MIWEHELKLPENRVRPTRWVQLSVWTALCLESLIHKPEEFAVLVSYTYILKHNLKQFGRDRKKGKLFIISLLRNLICLFWSILGW